MSIIKLISSYCQYQMGPGHRHHCWCKPCTSADALLQACSQARSVHSPTQYQTKAESEISNEPNHYFFKVSILQSFSVEY